MFLALPTERFEPATTPEVRFMETAAGMPAAISAWWYPGERLGYEFMYSKDQARRLATNVSADTAARAATPAGTSQ
jgi:glycine cleavage system aminomethyltransferase T